MLGSLEILARRRDRARVPRLWGVVAAGGVLALLLGYALVHRGVGVAVILVAVPGAGLVLTHRGGGMIAAVLMIMVLPAWHTLGTAQLNVIRAASLLAAGTALVARGYRPTLTDAALVAFVAVLVSCWVLEYDQPHVGRILTTELTPIGFYIGGRTLSRAREQRSRIFDITLLAGTIGALTILYEYGRGSPVFVNPALYSWNPSDSTIFRPGGVFGSPPGASTVMLFVILFGVARLQQLGGRLRLGAAACIGICIVALVLTFTRTAFIALAAAVVLYLWLTRSTLVRPIRVAFVFGTVLVAYVLLGPTLQRNTAFQEGVLRSGTLSQRAGYWGAALPIITSNAHTLFFGVGTGVLEVPDVFNDVAVPAKIAESPQLITTSLHSQYVTVLVEQGLVGLIALAGLMISAFLPAATMARRDRDPTLAAVAASIFAMAIVMITDTVFFTGAAFALLMLTAGLAAGTRPRGRRTAVVRPPSNIGTRAPVIGGILKANEGAQ